MTTKQSEKQAQQAAFIASAHALRKRNRDQSRAASQVKDLEALHCRTTKAGDAMGTKELTNRARRALARQVPDIDSLADVAGDKPEPFDKPDFGTPQYWLAYRVGWISEQEVAADKALFDKRRARSLKNGRAPACRMPQFKYHDRSRAYVPEMSARIYNDPRLTDGARRCATKLMELIYRRNRRFRNLGFTVSYLAKCLNRTERTVQTYLKQLREAGYIRHEVVLSKKARMCIGIFIELLKPIFPRHHRNAWPDQKENSATKTASEKYLFYRYYIYKQDRVGVESWSVRCMEGVVRAYEKAAPHILMEKTPHLTA